MTAIDGQTSTETDPPPDDVSVANRLFCGELRDDLAFPYPRLPADEQDAVDELIGTFRSYCDRQYDAGQVDAERWLPDRVLSDLAEMGLLGLSVPAELGGLGLSNTAYSRVFQAIGEVDATLAVVLGVHQSIGYKAIQLFGTAEQKQRFLPDLAAGRILAGYALTEENAGSDAYHVETTARPQPDGSYIIDGDKRYIGNGSRAGVFTTLARTDSGAHVALLVESWMEGFEVGERFDTLGLRGNDLRRLRFRGVRVPPANVLGDEGQGFSIAMEVLNNGRMSLGAGAAGAVHTMLDRAIDHACSRHQFGRPLAEFQLVRHKLAEMATQLYGIEAMGSLTTGLADRGVGDIAVESAMVKVAGTEFMWYAANRVFQIVGGAAYMTDQPYEKLLRDIRVFPVFEGANDVLRMLIALQGCSEVGEELEDLKHLDLSEPLESLGAVARYLGERLRRAVEPVGLPQASRELTDEADALGRQVVDLRNVTEHLLRMHGEGVGEHQAQLKRLASAATAAYSQIATIARITDAIERQPHGLDEELAVARSCCTQAAAQARRALDGTSTNDDAAMDQIADDLVARGGVRRGS